MLKQKIKITNSNNRKIRISLSSPFNPNATDDSISSFVGIQKSNSINEVYDEEKLKYKLENDFNLSLSFYNITTSSYDNQLTTAGFLESDLSSTNIILASSFIIIQLFNSINSQSQELLHTSYCNLYNIYISGGSSIFTFTNKLECSNLYLSNIFMDGVPDNITFYGRINFFNARTGRLHLFYNSDLEVNSTEEKLYFPIVLDKTNKTYGINDTLDAREINNMNYVNKINENVNKFREEKPNLPIGQAFLNTGIYSNII